MNPAQLTFVFLVNGPIGSSILFPDSSNVHVLSLPEVDSDFHAWEIGVRHMQDVLGGDCLSQFFDFVVFINCSAFGPVLDPTNEDHQAHWLFPFYKRIVEHEAAACSPCISYLNPALPEGEGPRLVSTFMMLRWSQEIAGLMLSTPISSIDDSSSNAYRFPVTYTTVLGSKKDKVQAILTGEYGVSRILLQHGYKLTCLLYDDISDFDDPTLYHLNNRLAPDRYNSFFGKNIPFYKTIFIKNIWRECECSYVSPPVYYDECIHYMESVLRIKPIWDDQTPMDWDMDAIPDSRKTGSCTFYDHFNWTSKSEYYKVFGRAEETVVFPSVLYRKPSHESFVYVTNKYLSIRTYLIEMIQTLLFLGYSVVLCLPENDHRHLFERHPAIRIHCVSSDSCSKEEFWEACRELYDNASEARYQLHVTDHVIFPRNGVRHMSEILSELHSNHQNNGWSYSEHLFELYSGIFYEEIAAVDPDCFFAEPIEPIIRSKEDGNEYTRYLRRYFV
jgi:hypothetical protein